MDGVYRVLRVFVAAAFQLLRHCCAVRPPAVLKPQPLDPFPRYVRNPTIYFAVPLRGVRNAFVLL